LSTILDLLGAYLDHPRRLLGCPYHCAKFGWNHSSNFDNMKLSVFCTIGLKTLIHAPPPKMGFSGDFTHKMGSNINNIQNAQPSASPL